MSTSQNKSKSYKTKPLDHSTHEVYVTIEHEFDNEIIQYEFYIPADIWGHSAVRHFIDKLNQLDPSATIFKGITGVWQGEEEDTNIYRLIRRKGEVDSIKTRDVLCDYVGEMMAELSEWKESAQDAFLFTETKISTTFSIKK
jgi:hypothetical protein